MACPINELVREKEVLGRLRYYYHNPETLIKDFPNGIIPLRKDFLLQQQIDPATCESMAAAARKFGVSLQRVKIVQVRINDEMQEIRCLPDIDLENGWKVDGIQNYSKKDEDNRYQKGPKWKDMSCALDSILMCLVFLNGGRRQDDQVWEELIVSTNPGVLTLAIIRKPWSVLTTTELSALRDKLRKCLQDHDATALSSDGGFTDLLLEYCGTYMPQLHATWARRRRCCESGPWHWVLRLHGQLKCGDRLGLRPDHGQWRALQPQQTRVNDLLQIHLDPFQRDGKIQPCRHKNCDGMSYQEQHVILDRPPPTLSVKASNDQWTQLLRPTVGLTRDITLNFTVYDVDGCYRIQARYAFWGCVLYKANHFILCVNPAARAAGREWVVYDGMSEGGRVVKLKESIYEFITTGKYTIHDPFWIRIE